MRLIDFICMCEFAFGVAGVCVSLSGLCSFVLLFCGCLVVCYCSGVGLWLLADCVLLFLFECVRFFLRACDCYCLFLFVFACCCVLFVVFDCVDLFLCVLVCSCTCVSCSCV